MSELLLWPLRVAAFDYLKGHEATGPFRLRAENEGLDLRLTPYYEIGAVYMGAEGPDAASGSSFVVQIDAFAAATIGGGAKVSEIGGAVWAAMDEADLELPGGECAGGAVLQSAILQHGYDPKSDTEHAHYSLRIKLTI